MNALLCISSIGFLAVLYSCIKDEKKYKERLRIDNIVIENVTSNIDKYSVLEDILLKKGVYGKRFTSLSTKKVSLEIVTSVVITGHDCDYQPVAYLEKVNPYVLLFDEAKFHNIIFDKK